MMITRWSVLSVILLAGCTSTQQQTFHLNANQTNEVADTQSIDFQYLCEQLSIIANMNLLVTPPTLPPHHNVTNSCHFSRLDNQADYHFAFTYQDSQDGTYKTSQQAYSSDLPAKQKSIALNAEQNENSIIISLHANNQDKAFTRLSTLVTDFLTQEYPDFYDTQTQQSNRANFDRDSDY